MLTSMNWKLNTQWSIEFHASTLINISSLTHKHKVSGMPNGGRITLHYYLCFVFCYSVSIRLKEYFQVSKRHKSMNKCRKILVNISFWRLYGIADFLANDCIDYHRPGEFRALMCPSTKISLSLSQLVSLIAIASLCQCDNASCHRRFSTYPIFFYSSFVFSNCNW